MEEGGGCPSGVQDLRVPNPVANLVDGFSTKLPLSLDHARDGIVLLKEAR